MSGAHDSDLGGADAGPAPRQKMPETTAQEREASNQMHKELAEFFARHAAVPHETIVHGKGGDIIHKTGWVFGVGREGPRRAIPELGRCRH